MKQLRKIKQLPTHTIIALMVFMLSLIPIVITGLHARPALDDYTFSALSSFAPRDDVPLEHYINRSIRHAVQNGGFFDFIGAIWNTVRDNYFEWQGTFSAIALFSVHPAVLFGSSAYPLTMFFTLGALIASTAFLCKSLFKENWLKLCIILLVCFIQWLPHISQGFFWYNGAIYYTFFYSLTIFNITLILRMLHKEKFCTYKIIAISVLNFFIGGGNYVSALLNAEITALILIFAIYKNKKEYKKYLAFICFAVMAIGGLIVSAAAQGNAVRASVYENTFSFSLTNVAITIFLSMAQAVYDIINWLNTGILVLILIAVPVIWHFVKNQSYQYKQPIIVTAVSFLIFASQNAPPIYAMGHVGDPKLRNIVYFSYILFLFGNVLYWLGWFSKRVKISIALTKTYYVYTFLFLVLFTLGAGMRLSQSKRAVVLDFEKSATTVLTMRDLHLRLPQNFLKEHQERQFQLESSAESVVSVAAFNAAPLTLLPFQPYDWESGALCSELTNNPNHWANRSLAAYYGIDEIIGLPPIKTVALLNFIQFDFSDTIFTVEAYEMTNMYFFRLRDIAYILQYVFNVNFDGQLAVDINREYLPVGGELKLSSTKLQAAYLHSNTLMIDNILYDIPSYEINGDIFHRDDFFEILGIEIFSLHGVLRFNMNFENFDIEINGEIVNFSELRPFVAGNRLLVPVREVFEALGFTVGWNGETNEISLTNGENTVLFAIGSDTFTTNNTRYLLESPALNINGTTFMPIQAVLESMGYSVYFDKDSLMEVAF